MELNTSDLAIQIIDSNLYLALSTADKNGNPWTSPLFYCRDEQFNFYFISMPSSQHSKNTTIRPDVSFAIYDAHWKEGQGLGVQGLGKVELLDSKKEINHALNYYQTSFIELDADSIMKSQYRLYVLKPSTFFVTDPESEVDKRVEVKLSKQALPEERPAFLCQIPDWSEIEQFQTKLHDNFLKHIANGNTHDAELLRSFLQRLMEYLHILHSRYEELEAVERRYTFRLFKPGERIKDLQFLFVDKTEAFHEQVYGVISTVATLYKRSIADKQFLTKNKLKNDSNESFLKAVSEFNQDNPELLEAVEVLLQSRNYRSKYVAHPRKFLYSWHTGSRQKANGEPGKTLVYAAIKDNEYKWLEPEIAVPYSELTYNAVMKLISSLLY